MSTVDLLAQGIAAARAGHTAEARATLLKVLETDDRCETAWLWLSGVMASSEERRICLENVIAINPANAHARRGLEMLTGPAQLAAPAPAEASPPTPATAAPPDPAPPATAAPPDPAPPAPATGATMALHTAPPATSITLPQVAVESDDAEEPCPYCGAVTLVRHRSCQTCHKSLMIRGRPRESRSVPLVILVILYGLNSLGALAGGVLMIISLVGMAATAATLGFDIPVAPLVGLIAGVILLVGLCIAMTVGLYQRKAWAYILHCISVGLAVLGTVALVVGSIFIGAAMTSMLAQLEQASPGDAAGAMGAMAGSLGTTVICNVVMMVSYLALTVLSYGDFFGPIARLSTAGLSGGGDSYNAGISYRDRGMWYMAAHEWELAARDTPRDMTVRRALGLAYAQLKRYDQAHATLSAALDLAPGDQQLAEDLALIERLAAKRPHPRAPGS